MERQRFLKDSFIRTVLVSVLLCACAGGARGQDEPEGEPTDRVERRHLQRDYMDRARECHENARTAETEDERRAAEAEARAAEESARRIAEEDGPVAEYEYYRDLARNRAEQVKGHGSKSEEGKRLTDEAAEAEKQAKDKLAEAKSKAKTDGVIRLDLARFYMDEADRYREQAEEYRRKGRLGEISEADAEKLAKAAEEQARSAMARARRWHTPIAPRVRPKDPEPKKRDPKKKVPRKKGAKRKGTRRKLLKAELGRTGDLAKRMKTKILDELRTVRAGKDKPAAYVDKRRKGLLAEYQNVDETIKRWEKTLRDWLK